MDGLFRESWNAISPGFMIKCANEVEGDERRAVFVFYIYVEKCVEYIPGWHCYVQINSPSTPMAGSFAQPGSGKIFQLISHLISMSITFWPYSVSYFLWVGRRPDGIRLGFGCEFVCIFIETQDEDNFFKLD